MLDKPRVSVLIFLSTLLSLCLQALFIPFEPPWSVLTRLSLFEDLGLHMGLRACTGWKNMLADRQVSTTDMNKYKVYVYGIRTMPPEN